MIEAEPTGLIGENQILEVPGFVGELEWKEAYSSMRTIAWAETQSAKYG